MASCLNQRSWNRCRLPQLRISVGVLWSLADRRSDRPVVGPPPTTTESPGRRRLDWKSRTGERSHRRGIRRNVGRADLDHRMPETSAAARPTSDARPSTTRTRGVRYVTGELPNVTILRYQASRESGHIRSWTEPVRSVTTDGSPAVRAPGASHDVSHTVPRHRHPRHPQGTRTPDQDRHRRGGHRHQRRHPHYSVAFRPFGPDGVVITIDSL